MDNIPTFISNYYSLSTDKREEEELYKILNEFKGKEELILKEGKRELFLKNCSLPAETIYDIAKNIGQIKQYDGQPRAIKSPTEKQFLKRFYSSCVARTGTNPCLELQYLASNTGNHYVALDFLPTARTTSICQVQYISNPSGLAGHICSCVGWYTPFFRYSGSQILTNRCGKEVGPSYSGFSKDIIYTIHAYQNDTFSINEYSGPGIAGSSVPSGQLSLFTYNCTASWSVPMKIFYYDFYENGVLSHRLIPAKRKEDDFLGMYDEITDTFYPVDDMRYFQGGPEV